MLLLLRLLVLAAPGDRLSLSMGWGTGREKSWVGGWCDDQKKKRKKKRVVGSGGGGFFPLLQGGCCGSTSQDLRKLFRPFFLLELTTGVSSSLPPPFSSPLPPLLVSSSVQSVGGERELLSGLNFRIPPRQMHPCSIDKK